MSYEGPERREDYHSMKQDVSRLVHAVFGNGKPGLDEQYRTLKSMVEDIKSDIKESKEARKRIAVGVITGVILAAINLLVTIILKH